MLKIAKIVKEKAGEVEGYFSDLIYMQGCFRDCGYCFNPELRSHNRGQIMGVRDVLDQLGEISEVVVVTGGEPLDQLPHVAVLIEALSRRKKVVLETSMYPYCVDELCDKILLTLKTWDVLEVPQLIKINESDNVIPCVVISHPWFDFKGYKKICKYLDEIYYRFYYDTLQDFSKEYKIANRNNTKFKKFDKIWI